MPTAKAIAYGTISDWLRQCRRHRTPRTHYSPSPKNEPMVQTFW
ncbi:hypothetical protein [Anabaena cylindrica]|nr:hypothetical protein [Anabaena cylindrica]